MRSEVWRPAAAARNRWPREARDPARQALRPGCEELAARIPEAMPETEARAREPKIATVERREASVPDRGTQGASKRLVCRVSRRSAHPSIGVSEAKRQNPGARRAAGTKGCCLIEAARRRRADEKLAVEERAAPVLREAHARLGLWRVCDNNECRRSKNCGGDVDQCGARAAPQGWTWLHHVLKALREGRSRPEAVEAANLATLGYRQRVTVRWKVKGWEPIEFVQLDDGSWEHADVAAARPPLDPRFVKLAASAWFLTPSHRHRVRR
jgi:hypothetical protein